ncbi:PREDICTED: BMP and activin membrane-bound inhibitor homolog [Ceratosolen solmsi marchali]|uniref:BMP and activin membrane-bound inhibitor homolog n=1 Tax=Ceratosolen solmsi marchali TaxID=326594 RepID=A0AAJ6YJZ1_9HYME|nr:PREDICTED: BMP and activin membrane-bound inhibitor homolog [Ceratosolen solmsi marchali]
MVPRELIALATLTTLSVATSAAAVAAASIDFDLAGGGGGGSGSDYEVLPDTEERTSTADNDDVAGGRGHRAGGEVRCYCNQPHCVSQGYMCRGRGCFTELPLPVFGSTRQQQLVAASRPEHAAYSGCLEESFAERPCPQGKLCCGQDLCNHVDSPAMRSRLNKTLQVLLGEQRAYFGSMQPSGQEVQTSDGWFKTATIAVPICGFVVLLILASLAIRLLQPVPSQGDKLNGLRMPENAPPLLGPPKLPLV